MRGHFQNFTAHYRLWVHLSQPKDLKWVTGENMRGHFQNFTAHYRLWVYSTALR